MAHYSYTSGLFVERVGQLAILVYGPNIRSICSNCEAVGQLVIF